MGKKNAQYRERMRQQRLSPSTQEISKEHAKIRLSFEFCDAGEGFCLSLCEKDDVKHAVDCFRKLTTMTWMQAIGTGTNTGGMKTGLHCTVYKDGDLKYSRPSMVSRDTPIIGLRAGSKHRIFGVRIGEHFYPFWFDPNHVVCPV
jgi:hypothetical protein